MFRWLICFLVIPACTVMAQPADFINIQKTGLNNYSIVYSQYYDGNSLWGYMDGGADLYLEYGLEGLLVEEIKYKETNIKCEIYKMKDVVSAFGIFSIQRHSCGWSTKIKSNHCINNYQVQLDLGNYYISLINPTGDSIAQQVSLEIASKFSNCIEEKEVPFPNLNVFKEQNQGLIFIKGKIALGNVYPQALNYLENISDYTMWMLPSANKKEPVLSVIAFENDGDISKYAELAFPGITFDNYAQIKLKKGGYRLAKKIDGNQILQAEGKIGKELKKIFPLYE